MRGDGGMRGWKYEMRGKRREREGKGDRTGSVVGKIGVTGERLRRDGVFDGVTSEPFEIIEWEQLRCGQRLLTRLGMTTT